MAQSRDFPSHALGRLRFSTLPVYTTVVSATQSTPSLAASPRTGAVRTRGAVPAATGAGLALGVPPSPPGCWPGGGGAATLGGLGWRLTPPAAPASRARW